MERNVSFDTAGLTDIQVHLAWAQLEIFADEVDKLQVMVSGDETSVKDLRVEIKESALLVEQPQLGITLNITESHWLQVCIRVPKTWDKGVHCSTISGLLGARKISGTEIDLETVSGDLRVLKLNAPLMALKTVSGDTYGEDLTADKLNMRSISGDATLDTLNVDVLKCNSVSGEQSYSMVGTFHKVDVTAVSGNVIVTAPVTAVNVSLRSMSGRVRTEGINITDGTGIPSVRVTGVSADLKLVCVKS